MSLAAFGFSPPGGLTGHSRHRRSYDQDDGALRLQPSKRPQAVSQAMAQAQQHVGFNSGDSQLQEPKAPVQKRTQGLLSASLVGSKAGEQMQSRNASKIAAYGQKLLAGLQAEVKEVSWQATIIQAVAQNFIAQFASRAVASDYKNDVLDELKYWFDVLKTVAELFPQNQHIIGAAFLHATMSSCRSSQPQISVQVGASVCPQCIELAAKVQRVQQLHDMMLQSDQEVSSEQLQQVLVMTQSMAEPSAVLITLVARLHRIRQQDVLGPDTCGDAKKRLAKQTLELLVPLAERLGANWLKGQLQDECFRYLHPKEYYALQELLPRSACWKIVQEYVELVQEHLRRHGISAQVVGRPKSLYSIYRKIVLVKGNQFSLDAVQQLKDIFAVRIITRDVDECYRASDAVQRGWDHVVDCKDMIKSPKPNGYQSLHVTVDMTRPRGLALAESFTLYNTQHQIQRRFRMLELQVRTQEMHCGAEYGLQAHWRYKENPPAGATAAPTAEGAPMTAMELEEYRLVLWQRFVTEWVLELQDKVAGSCPEAPSPLPEADPQVSALCGFPVPAAAAGASPRHNDPEHLSAMARVVDVLQANGIDVGTSPTHSTTLFLHKAGPTLEVVQGPPTCTLEHLRTLLPGASGAAWVNQAPVSDPRTLIQMGDVVEFVATEALNTMYGAMGLGGVGQGTVQAA